LYMSPVVPHMSAHKSGVFQPEQPHENRVMRVARPLFHKTRQAIKRLKYEYE
jgi:hypothetical protein